VWELAGALRVAGADGGGAGPPDLTV
jgi:hypothetical protein